MDLIKSNLLTIYLVATIAQNYVRNSLRVKMQLVAIDE